MPVFFSIHHDQGANSSSFTNPNACSQKQHLDPPPTQNPPSPFPSSSPTSPPLFANTCLDYASNWDLQTP